MKDLSKITIDFLGDSITGEFYWVEPKYNYILRMQEKLGCNVNNFGEGGTRIAKQTVPSSVPAFDEYFLLRAKRMPDADFVFVLGGTNDYGHGDSEMGSLDSTDDATFCGAVRNLANYLVDRFGRDNVLFILPLPRFDEDNPYGDGTPTKPRPSLKVYNKNEKAILDELNVPCLDLHGIFPYPTSNKWEGYYKDGLHPTPEGHQLLADCLVKYLEEWSKRH